MARIWMSGFEAGHIGVLAWGNGDISNAQHRTGSYSYYCGNSERGNFDLSDDPSEIYVRMGLYPTNWGVTSDHVWCGLYDETGDNLLTFCFDSGQVVVRRGDEGGTILATGSIAVGINAWSCIEFHAKIDDAAGVVQTKVDGVSDIDFTGDTKHGSYTGIDHMTLGFDESNSNTLGYYDDIAINDTTGSDNNSWIGRGGIYGLFPEGAGTHTDFTPSAGDNHDCVDEVPPNDDTDYVESNVVGHQDTYAMDDLVPTDGDIQAVQWIARAKLDAAGSGNFQRALRYDGTDYNGSDLAVDVSYAYFQEILEECPDETAWTIAKVNALEAGMEIS